MDIMADLFDSAEGKNVLDIVKWEAREISKHVKDNIAADEELMSPLSLTWLEDPN